jgi:hypothetical protein
VPGYPVSQSSDSAAAITEEDLREFDDSGVLVLRSFFDTSESAALRTAWGALKRDVEERQVLERSARFALGVLPVPIGDIYHHPRMVDLAVRLLGADVALYMNRLLLKDEHWSGAVAIHQDMPYFTGGQEKVSIFVPLSRTAAEGGNGGLKFVLGSHRYGGLGRGTVNRSQFEPMADIAPTLEVGDIVVMNFLTWHYSEDAVVPDDRPLLQIVFQPSSDGSYGGAKLGVPEPVLVTGGWKTRHFAEWGVGMTPDS